MDERELKAGQKAALQLCEECGEKMRGLITPSDLWKGARNPNHLIAMYRANCCTKCLAMINREALKYARGAR